MSVSPAALLALAKKLVETASSEVEYRNAIGRAYYAAFHAADAFHNSLPQPGRMAPKPTGFHEELFQRLCNPNISSTDRLYDVSRQVGTKVRDFQRIRVQADYDLQREVKKEDAVDALARLHEVVKLIRGN